MLFTRTSIFSGVTRTIDLDVTDEEYTAWGHGTPIQYAMPRLNADQREFIMTGLYDGEYEEMLGVE